MKNNTSSTCLNYTHRGDSAQPQAVKTSPAHPPADYCPHCGAQSIKIELMPPSHTHHSAAMCSQCGAFRRWLAKPENQLERNLRRSLIERWLGDPRLSLSEWERQFLRSIQEAKNLSPKQCEVFDKLRARLGGLA
jgi:hypothetical protein